MYEKGNNRKLREDKSKGRNQYTLSKTRTTDKYRSKKGRSVKLAFNSVERE